VIYALFDQEFRNDSLLKYPLLYKPGIMDALFNAKRFWLWFLNATWQSTIIGLLT